MPEIKLTIVSVKRRLWAADHGKLYTEIREEVQTAEYRVQKHIQYCVIIVSGTDLSYHQFH